MRSVVKALLATIQIIALLPIGSCLMAQDGLDVNGHVKWTASKSEAASAEELLPFDEPSDAVRSGRISAWNQLLHLLFTSRLVPEEIQNELPEERKQVSKSDIEYFQKGWYFQKRKGEPSDLKVFGGDVRTSPRKDFEDDERREVKRLLKVVFPQRIDFVDETAEPLFDVTTQLVLQWDLLHVWWMLEKNKCDDVELLELLALGVMSLAMPGEKVQALPHGLDAIRSLAIDTNESLETSRPFFPSDFDLTSDNGLSNDNTESRWIEVDRKSSALFKADRSLRVTRTFLGSTDRPTVERLLNESQTIPIRQIQVPDRTTTILIQFLIGVTPDFEATASPIIDEFRVRVADGPAQLSGNNRTSSRDGSSHWIYQRTRYGTARARVNDFRFVADTAESLFIEYGTLKHATYAAQCALCHRRTDDGGQAPGGIRLLSKVAQPTVAVQGARERLAIQEMIPVLEKLKERSLHRLTLNQHSPAVSHSDVISSMSGRVNDTETVRLPPRKLRTVQERGDWVASLREAYSRPSETWPEPTVDPGVEWREVGNLPAMSHPIDNPFSKEKAELGKKLFFDPRLSGSGQIACASCHDPDLGWADGRSTSFGHDRKLLARNAPSIRNSGHQKRLFWDGRAESLEDQVKRVLENPNEMRATSELVAMVVNQNEEYLREFRDQFQIQFPGVEEVAKAIACFERTIVGGSSRFDGFVKGKNSSLTDQELIGLDLFRREARCMNCHNGPLFSDGGFHEVGLSYFGRRFEDLGRYRITNDTADVGRFRTPSLRDVTRTTPLMHNGLFELPGVLNMYNAGMPTLKRNSNQGTEVLFPQKSHLLKPLGLNRHDLEDIGAFLATLEEPKRRILPPSIPGLHIESPDQNEDDSRAK